MITTTIISCCYLVRYLSIDFCSAVPAVLSVQDALDVSYSNGFKMPTQKVHEVDALPEVLTGEQILKISENQVVEF